MSNIVPESFNNANQTFDLIAEEPGNKALPYFLNECAKRFAAKTAIKFHGRSLTYRSLYESSNKLARLLMSRGIGAGDIVGVALDRSPEMIVSLIAILKAGAAYLPLDPEYPKDRIEFMLEDSSAKILLTSRKYRSHFQSSAIELTIEDCWSALADYDAQEPEVRIADEDLAYILYTSGSTGKPKGVLITHFNLANMLLSMQREPGMIADDRLLAITTISFDIAGLELYLPLMCGAEIMLADTHTAKDGSLLLDIIKNEQITVMQATPYTWRMLLEAGWEDYLPIKIICGGEPLPKDLADKLIKRCLELWNQYGPTETTIYSTQKLITSADDITIGKPIDNTEVYILDEDLNRLPDGAVGEIFIGGSGVAKGYLNRPELNAERFIDNRFSGQDGDKMYRTGDLGRITPNGEIQCLGRIDHQVKVRGYRIELEEIEYALLSSGNVKQAVVVAFNDMPGEARLIAYVTPLAGKAIEPGLLKNSLRQAAAARLPEYMVPDQFIIVPSIPITPNGKVDRKALPRPEFNPADRVIEYVAPRTETEKLLTKIWEELMGLEKISITDNFFALGGRSLVAVQIMARIEQATGNRLPLATLFENSTIEKLSLCLAAGSKRRRGGSLVPIKPGGSKLPLYVVHGDGLNVLFFNTLATKLDPEQPVYGLQAKGLEGEEDPLDVMEDIAANYVAEIIAQNPSGPYLLAGYSFGGYIAVEMRKQMAAMGKDVKMLIIFDTDAEKSEGKTWRYLLPRKIKRHFPRLLASFGSAIKQPLVSLRKGFTSLVENIKSLRQLESTDIYKQIKNIKDKHQFAFDNYAIVPFDDKVHLYRAKICVHYVDDAEFLGWKKYALKGVEVYDVPGDHLSMLVSPNVEEFAAILQSSIDEHLEKHS